VRVVAIVQARRGSTRLPDKVLAEVAGRPLLAWVLDRARRIPGVDLVVMATTTAPADAVLIDVARREGAEAYAGSEQDVLDRYYRAARLHSADAAVRLTADCPLLDPHESGRVVARFLQGDVDYASNTHPPSYPDGLDTEVFSVAALDIAWRHARLQSEREHVTPYIWDHAERFRHANITCGQPLSHLRLTVDDPADLDLVRTIFDRLAPSERADARLDRILAILAADPDLLRLNATTCRNEGYQKSLLDDRSHP
jgi:spore coat polysaccharide biosynthesis protein SpsF (cytidylyltransferase family)